MVSLSNQMSGDALRIRRPLTPFDKLSVSGPKGSYCFTTTGSPTPAPSAWAALPFRAAISRQPALPMIARSSPPSA